MKKIVILALALSVSTPLPSEAESITTHRKETFNSAVDFTKKTAICTGLIAAPYLVGRCSSAIVLALAHRRFDDDIRLAIFHSASALHQSINCRYNRQVNTFLIQENKMLTLFPLISYKNDLDWYINSMWYLQLFHIGTDTREEIQRMISNLTAIRTEITSWSEYTRQLQELYTMQQRNRIQ